MFIKKNFPILRGFPQLLQIVSSEAITIQQCNISTLCSSESFTSCLKLILSLTSMLIISYAIQEIEVNSKYSFYYYRLL